jgi:hypothetical protein
VFAVNDEGAPTIVAPVELHDVDGLAAVDIITYLTPSRFELAAGRATAKDGPAVPVKYVFTFVSVTDVNVFVATTDGD